MSCGHKSDKGLGRYICRNCKIAEKVSAFQEDEEEIKEGPKIVWVSSVRLNHTTQQFIFDPNFFDLVGIEESQERNTIVSKQNAVLDQIAGKFKPKPFSR